MGEVRTERATTTVVTLGVTGSGKSSVAVGLADVLGWPFAEGDDFHSSANVAKMRSGRPLDDEDRWPWLRALAGWVGEQEAAGRDAVLTCSALKRSYRDLLRRGHRSVWFLHVDVPPDELERRLRTRTDHFMPPSLLRSQLDALEPLQPDEPGATISGNAPPAAVVSRAVAALTAGQRAAPST